MIYSGNFTVVLDSCVLYPAPMRDLLLSIAQQGLYKTKWSKRIHKEWSDNLLENRPDLKRSQINKTIKAMDSAFPAATTEGFEFLIPTLQLPDENDRHVLACAIKSGADLIITNNIKDFPKSKLKQHDLEAQQPDDFVSNLIDLDHISVCLAIEKMLLRLKNPPMTKTQLFNVFKTKD